jgi:hypothetical protein
MDGLTGLPGIEWSRYARAEQTPYIRDINSPTFLGSYGSVFKATNGHGEAYAVKELRKREGAAQATNETAE